MRFKALLGIAALLALALTACASDSGPTPEPEVIVVTATPEQAAGGATTLPVEMLDVEWQLHSVLESEPAAQSVIPEPQKYTIQFTPEGTAAITADCNQVLGNYTVQGTSLSIEIGPTTLAFCGEESGDTLYLTALGAVTTYELREDGLALNVQDAARLQYIEANAVIDLPDEPGGVDIVADVNAHVRTGPGVQFRISYWAVAGDQGEVIGQSPDGLYWVVPFPPDNQHYDQGWVLKSATTISNPDNLEIPETTPPLLNPTVYVVPPESAEPQGKVAQRAPVMTGPGNAYQMWGLTSIGADVVITGKNGDWWRIQLPTNYSASGDGWVPQQYLATSFVDVVQDVGAPTLDTEARPTASGGSQAAIRLEEKTTVRAGPGTSYSALFDAEADWVYGIIGESSDGDWWVISLPIQTASVGYGWVPKDSGGCSKCDVPSPYTPVYRNP